jgi:hypothetical protein
MPNNQDAVKMLPCPFCGNDPQISDDVFNWYGCPNANCPASVVNTSAKTWQTRAPTPREQELEAENKALWDGLNSIANNTCCNGCQEAKLVAQSAIQKAKERR